MAMSAEEPFSAPDPGFFILTTCMVALAWAGYNFKVIEATSLNDVLVDQSSDRTGLKSGKMATESQMKLLREVYEYVRSGAGAFLLAEYTICLQFVIVFSALIVCLIGWYVELIRPRDWVLMNLATGGAIKHILACQASWTLSDIHPFFSITHRITLITLSSHFLTTPQGPRHVRGSLHYGILLGRSINIHALWLHRHEGGCLQQRKNHS